MTKAGKGGRPAWVERPGDPKVLYTVNLYRSQLDWIKANGGAEWLRSQIEKAMRKKK